MKICTKCNIEKELISFGKDKYSKDSFQFQCKKCKSQVTREYCVANPDKVKELAVKYKVNNPERYAENHRKQSARNRLNNPERVAQSNKKYIEADWDRHIKIRKKTMIKWKANNPEKVKAHMAVKNAIRNGSLKSMPCEVCDDVKTDAHHWSYLPEHHLDIKWLCKIHHRQEHQRLKEVNNGLQIMVQ